jgi:histidinol-phosphate aminotransferase
VTFTEDRWRSESLLTAGNLLIIRSMTKDYALAGLRLGYGLAANPVLDPINRVTLPWSVNSVAQQAGLRCLDLGEEYLDQVRDYALRGARTLQQGFRELGFQVAPSQAHFFLVKVGDAQLFQSRLLREGILVRDCSSFGLDAWIRVSPRRSEDNELLLQAVGRLSR